MTYVAELGDLSEGRDVVVVSDTRERREPTGLRKLVQGFAKVIDLAAGVARDVREAGFLEPPESQRDRVANALADVATAAAQNRRDGLSDAGAVGAAVLLVVGDRYRQRNGG